MNKWAGKICTTSQMSNNNFRKKFIIRKTTHDDIIVISDSNKNHMWKHSWHKFPQQALSCHGNHIDQGELENQQWH